MTARVSEVEARGSCVREPEQGRANLGAATGPAHQPLVEPGAGPGSDPHALLEAGSELVNGAFEDRRGGRLGPARGRPRFSGA